MPSTFDFMYLKHLAGKGNHCSHFSDFLAHQFLAEAVMGVPVAAAFEIAENQIASALLCLTDFLSVLIAD